MAAPLPLRVRNAEIAVFGAAQDPAPGLVDRVRKLEVTLNGEDAPVPTTGVTAKVYTVPETEFLCEYTAHCSAQCSARELISKYLRWRCLRCVCVCVCCVVYATEGMRCDAGLRHAGGDHSEFAARCLCALERRCRMSP